MNNEIPELFAQQGVLIELLILGWITLGLIVIAIGAGYLAIKVGDDFSFWWFTAGSAALIALFTGVIWVCIMIPFDTKYMHYYEVEGHVTSVSNVLTEASGDLTRQPVVTIDGLERPIVVDDPRAIQLEGKDVTLRCTINWHYQAADTYDCKIKSFGD